MIALVGARPRARLAEAMGALALKLDENDIARIEAAIPSTAVAGTRYDARGMAFLDSEREGASARPA